MLHKPVYLLQSVAVLAEAEGAAVVAADDGVHSHVPLAHLRLPAAVRSAVGAGESGGDFLGKRLEEGLTHLCKGF